MTESGQHLETVRIPDDPEYLRAVLAACGVAVVMSDLFGAGGQALLERVVLASAQH